MPLTLIKHYHTLKHSYANSFMPEKIMRLSLSLTVLLAFPCVRSHLFCMQDLHKKELAQWVFVLKSFICAMEFQHSFLGILILIFIILPCSLDAGIRKDQQERSLIFSYRFIFSGSVLMS